VLDVLPLVAATGVDQLAMQLGLQVLLQRTDEGSSSAERAP
jgi:hypothetical protein